MTLRKLMPMAAEDLGAKSMQRKKDVSVTNLGKKFRYLFEMSVKCINYFILIS
jgi:hypothetical protein